MLIPSHKKDNPNIFIDCSSLVQRRAAALHGEKCEVSRKQQFKDPKLAKDNIYHNINMLCDILNVSLENRK